MTNADWFLMLAPFTGALLGSMFAGWKIGLLVGVIVWVAALLIRAYA